MILDIQDTRRTKHRVQGTIKSGYLWLKTKAKASDISLKDDEWSEDKTLALLCAS